MSESESSLRAALAEWGIVPASLRRTDSGINNLLYLVEADGMRYVLRAYRDSTSFGRPAYEHGLLGVVGSRDLPFLVPEVVRTKSGETLVSFDGLEVSLYREIPGVSPERGSLRDVESCGVALGRLDIALSEVEPPKNCEPRPVFGDLDRVGSTATDASLVPDRLPIPDESKESLRRLFEDVRGLIPGLHARLPHQIVHSDPSYGNVLMSGGNVAGILDFEFAAPDLRVLDLASGLDTFCLYESRNELVWPLVRSFSRGYLREVELTPPEIEAIPILLIIRQTTMLLHAISKGDSSEIPSRCENVLRLRDWIGRNGAKLVREVERASHERDSIPPASPRS